MKVRFDGFNEGMVTFECTSNVQAGMPVKMIGVETVGACSSGENFIGICRTVSDGFASVQLTGYVEVPYTGNMGIGHISLYADGDGGVKIAESGGLSHWAITVDTTAHTVGILL